MRSYKRYSRISSNASINIVPYVDVMLVLIVILLASASSVIPSLINLPNVGQKASKAIKPIMLIVYKDGQTSFNNQAKDDINTLIQSLKNKYTLEQPIVIAGDKDARYDYVISTMSSLKQAGFSKVGLLVKSK